MAISWLSRVSTDGILKPMKNRGDLMITPGLGLIQGSGPLSVDQQVGWQL